MEKILIIKHGALGDWILATGVFKAIRIKHPKAHIVLLTESAYLPLAKQSGYFDELWIDNRQGFLETLKVLFKIRKAEFSSIYDIQRAGRTKGYYYFLKAFKRKNFFWSGNIESAPGFFVDDLNQHIVDRMALQLKAAHINTFPDPNISWLTADITPFKVSKPYALIIPGCAKHRPKKRWTAEGYAEVIAYLAKQSIQSVLIGTEADRDIIEAILNECKNLKPLNLINKTSFAELAELARQAEFILGSDTGSMHIAANTGTDSLTLFCSTESIPQFNKAWGEQARAIEVQDLNCLGALEVIGALQH